MTRGVNKPSVNSDEMMKGLGRTMRDDFPPPATSRRLPSVHRVGGRSCGVTWDLDPHRTLQVKRERNRLN